MIFGNDSQGENTIKLVHVSGLMDYQKWVVNKRLNW